jgi:UDP-N-acetylmuramoyl-tripeptide--D-alanyl-D-alanine ligase
VVELGMNHPGEIAYLAAIAQPTVALVNNAQREHLEFMATVEAVARENGSVLAALPADGVAVFPAGEIPSRPCGRAWRAGAGPACVWRQRRSPTSVWLVAWTQGHGRWTCKRPPAGALHFALHIAGRHNVRNALAATACALAAGAPLEAITRGLEAFEPVKGRSRAFSVMAAGHSLTVVDDTYNANPDSVRAAIDVLAELPGPRLLVLGDMGEVGDQGPQFHARLATRAPVRHRAAVHAGRAGRHAACAGAISTTSSR